MTASTPVDIAALSDDEFRSVLRRWFAENPAPELPQPRHVGEDVEAQYLAAQRHWQKRLAEAARLGFTRAVLPVSAPDPPAGVRAIRVPTLAAALAVLGEGATGLTVVR